jgi:hypothetical protein
VTAFRSFAVYTRANQLPETNRAERLKTKDGQFETTIHIESKDWQVTNNDRFPSSDVADGRRRLEEQMLREGLSAHARKVCARASRRAFQQMGDNLRWNFPSAARRMFF